MNHRERHESEGIFSLKLNPGEGLCMVKGCRKEGHRRKFSLCHRCYQYRWRLLNKRKGMYAMLRDHARGRGIAFTVTYDYLMGLADAYAYFDHEAESRGEFPSIDRIDASRGYEPGNLRIVTVSQNVIKGHRERYLPANVQAILDRKRQRAKENPHLADEMGGDDECPF